MQVRAKRSGFTLIELLIVVVIIGILAAVAIPRFANTKGKAFLASMKSDLRNLAVAQEGYYFDNRTYTNSLVALSFTPSTGVTVNIVTANATGWSATSQHAQSVPILCAVFTGAAPPLPPATTAGIVACQ
jgi:prepilin-type N-terminal cleavage/methylation domain-containing protein